MEKITRQYRINFQGLRGYIRNPLISGQAKAILVNILLYAGVDGEAFPSHTTLSQDHGLSVRHIKNLTKELKEVGAIDWIRGGFGKSNRYTPNREIYFPIDKDRGKSTSSYSGNTIPTQSGNIIPTKVVTKEIQLSSSQVQQIFEKTSKKKLGITELELLHKLCMEYSEPWVIDAIKETEERNLNYLTPNYLTGILEDWRAFGKPVPKPTLTPCGKGKCDGGGWIEGNTYFQCECRTNYIEKLELWKKNNGRL